MTRINGHRKLEEGDHQLIGDDIHQTSSDENNTKNSLFMIKNLS